MSSTTDLSEPMVQAETGRDPATAARLLRSFVTMCVCFAINLGTVTTVVAYAGADFKDIGNYSNGLLFGSYCVTALFFGNVIVEYLGLKMSLVLGLSQYCVYLLLYFLASFQNNDSAILGKSLVLIGACVGGAASGYLWVAQGAYFQECAKAYALSCGISQEKASNKFGSIFATLFLFFEITLRFVGGAIQQSGKGGKETMYTAFFFIGLATVMGIGSIRNVSTERQGEISRDMIFQKSTIALKVLTTDPKMSLMLPTEFTFGLMAAFLNSYVGPKITKPIIGGAYVGYFSGIISGVGCIVSFVAGKIIASTGQKWPFMLAGGIAFSTEAGIFVMSSSENWDNSNICIATLIFVYILHGVGRGIFESTNKAVIADFFGDQAPAAFANVIWSSGGASALGFFMFPLLAGDANCKGTKFEISQNGGRSNLCEFKAQVGICIGMALLGISCYLSALKIHKRS